ncbi:MAG: hypothetical protein AAF747_02795 [Planctomycetota bacterium]
MKRSHDIVIACDWSAEKGRKPKPQENRCWLAWGRADESPSKRSDPLYMPTREEAEACIAAILRDHADARIFLGFDFAIGYPCSADNTPVLPVGRELCALLAELVTDDATGVNNRFEVGDELNRRVRTITGLDHGPFWARPREYKLHDLPERRPTGETGVPQFRAAEKSAQAHTKTRPQSAFKLAGIGSVGSQSLVGLPAIHRLITDEQLAPRCRLWPFEQDNDRDDQITIAEIYPTLYEERSPTWWYKDARQVVDTRNAIIDAINSGIDPAAAVDHPRASTEGWIIGVPSDAADLGEPS